MNSADIIEIERATERLRQERETFEQNKLQDSSWFRLRLLMGFTTVVGLMGILIFCIYVLVNWRNFPVAVQVSAGTAICVDAIGLFIGVFKDQLRPKSATLLAPVTERATGGRRKRAEEPSSASG
jgi:ABC-type nickel/cobalt efflux system permease component RcnA